MKKKLVNISAFANRILKYFVAAIIISVPLYPKFPFLAVPGTYVSIRLEDFLILLTTLVWFVASLPKLIAFIRHDLVARSILIYLTIGILSVGYGCLVTKTILPSIGILHWIRRIEYFLPFFIGFASINERKDLIFYIKCLMLVVCVTFIYGFGQKYFSWPIITTQNSEYSTGVALRYTPGGHINAGFAGHYDMASVMFVVIPILFTLIFTLKKNVGKVVVLGVSLLAYWLLVESASRISVASFLVAISLTLLVLKKMKILVVVVVVSILIAAFSSNLVGRYSRLLDVTVKKILHTSSVLLVKNVYAIPLGSPSPTPFKTISPSATPVPVFEDRSTSIRFNVEWPRALRALSKNPLLGTGYSSITLATDNDYLRLLGETGILGFAAYLLIIATILVKFGKCVFSMSNKLERYFIVSVLSGIVGILLTAVFIDIFEASKFAIIFWLLVGMSYRLVINNDNDSV